MEDVVTVKPWKHNFEGATAMLWSFGVLLACQAVGEVLHLLTGLPIPGTIWGIGLLLAWLCGTRRATASDMLPAADALLPYLGLFFVPPGVMAVMELSRLPSAWLPIALAILVSSMVTLVAAGRMAQALLAAKDRRKLLTSQTSPDAINRRISETSP
jgi:holin-like protein